MKWPELPDEWTHKPIWLPPYPIPYGFWGNVAPFYTKKQVLGEPPKRKYYFFDTPDYEDCHKKIYSYGMYGAKAATFVSFVDVMGNRQLSYARAFGRMVGHFGRIGGSFLMYSAITCCVANIRGEKQDSWEHPWNHIIGGASVGLIWGYKFHSTGVGAGVGAACALLGVLNLRANTPTKNHPNGWQINFPANVEEIREENGALGGRHYRDWRVGWVIADPGRKDLE